MVYRHDGSMLQALERAATKIPGQHLASWYFLLYLSTEPFCQRRAIDVESRGIGGVGFFPVAQLGLKMGVKLKAM